MSDFKIQTDAPNELPGGVQNETRTGAESSQQFPLSGRQGVNVERQDSSLVSPNSAAGAASRPLESVMQMSVSGTTHPTIQPAVGVKTIAGSFAGDHRANHDDTAAAAVLRAATGAYRGPVNQFPNGRADTGGKGGPFGNEHSDQSYPDVKGD